MSYVGRVTEVYPQSYVVYCIGPSSIHGMLPVKSVPEKLSKNDFIRVSRDDKKSSFGRTLLTYEGRSTKDVFEQAKHRIVEEVSIDVRLKTPRHGRMGAI